MGRIACILVADFSLAAIVRANRALEGKPLALSESLAPHAELTTASRSARANGIRSGMTIAQARAISPALIVTSGSSAAERSAAAALINVAESVSPVVEPGEPGCVWLDLAGMERIHGSEAELASEIVRRVRRVEMEAAVGIAANREIAYLAARCGGIRIIEPGMEREFLDWLPLDALDLGVSDSDGDLAATLARWGLKRLGDLMRLDPQAIGSRLGRQGVELVRLAHGGNSRPLAARPRDETFSEAADLDYGIETLEPLGFVMRGMLDRLVARLSMRGFVVGDMTLALKLDGHRRDDRQIAVAAATNEAKSLLALLMLNLEASPPAAAIEGVTIAIEPRVSRPSQADMFAQPAPAPDRLQTTLARLAALCGPDHVGTLRPENSHRPEAVRLDPFNPPPAPSVPLNGAVTKKVAQLVIRAIRPATEIEVMCSRGMPEFVRGATLGGRVVSFAGPWRCDGEWWCGASGFARDYYELALDDGGVYRIFRDLNSERWYADGVYD